MNVNVPNIGKKDLKGFLITKQGNQSFEDTYEKRIDPRGNSYFWIKGEMINDDSCVNTMDKQLHVDILVLHQFNSLLTNELYINQLKKKILDE